MPPVVPVRLPATTSSCSVTLRSEPRLAADSSSASVPVPSGVDATVVAADRDSPSSGPRSVESHLSALTFRISWASWRSVFCFRTRLALISAASPIHSSNCNSERVVQTTAHARSLPFPHAPSSPVPPGHGRISPLPRGAAVAALAVPQSRYLQKQFVGSPGDNRIL